MERWHKKERKKNFLSNFYGDGRSKQCRNKGKMGNNITQAELFAAAAAKSLQLCPTLCDPIDGSPSGSRVPGILQARTPEWVAISFSNA